MSGDDNQIKELLERAQDVGQYGIFPVFSLSYYPVAAVVENISHKLGLAFSRPGDKTVEELLRNDIWLHAPTLLLGGPPFTPFLKLGDFSNNRSEAYFTFYRQRDLYYGVLDIKGIHNPNIPKMDVSIIPTVVLSPFRHTIDRYILQKAGHVTFYTLDENGSKWSVHCEGKKN